MTTLCAVCEGTLDEDRLRAGPLKRVCLECLSDIERRALEHDLEVANQIQANLLPARNFSFGRWQINYHYQPLGAVSGDHIDLIRPGRTGQALHFLFGDVSGKGVAASILMANLQALFRSLVSQELPLGEIIGRANALFHESTAANSYATLVAGRLNGEGSLEFSNAGHNPPLLVRDGSVSPLAAGALPLGFSGQTRFEAECFRLEPQDFLFLYTDGLSEATNAEGEEYGAKRLAESLVGLRGLPARAIVESVVDGANAFQGGTPQVDDLTAMAICWRG
jgi:sigma-B regulation protein RsbU (phosphoserine phosphatase)